MVAVLPRNHRDAEAKAYPIEKCKKENLIMPSEGDDADVRELFKRHGIVPNVRLKGLGIGIMNEGITRNWKTGTVIIPVDPPSSIELGICLPSLEDAAPAVREFVIFAANQLKVKIPKQ